MLLENKKIKDLENKMNLMEEKITDLANIINMINLDFIEFVLGEDGTYDFGQSFVDGTVIRLLYEDEDGKNLEIEDYVFVNGVLSDVFGGQLNGKSLKILILVV